MAIELRNCSFSYPKDTSKALNNISVTFPSGKAVLITGPGGSGKTTLVDAILGKLKAPGIYLDGKDISNLEPWDRPFGYYGQIVEYGEANKKGTVRDFLCSDNFALMKGKKRRDNLPFSENDLKEWATAYGIEYYLDRHPRTLSGGARFRADLTRAILWGYKAFIYDPLQNYEVGKAAPLDPRLFETMIEEPIERITEKGLIFLFTRRGFELSAFMGQEMAVLKLGRLVTYGSSEELCSCPNNGILASFIWGSPNVIYNLDMFRIEGDRKPTGDDHLMVSPYGISFVEEGQRGIKATLKKTYCRGAYTLCVISIKDQEFRFFHYGICPFKPGAQVEVDIDPDEVFIYHQDDNGTMEPIFDR